MWWMAPGVRLRLGLFPQRSSFSSTTSRTAGSVQLCESLDDRQEERQNRDLAAPSDARIANDSDVLRETSSSLCGWPAGSACVLGHLPGADLLIVSSAAPYGSSTGGSRADAEQQEPQQPSVESATTSPNCGKKNNCCETEPRTSCSTRSTEYGLLVVLR